MQTIEEVKKAYYDKYGVEVPYFMELSEEDQKAEWFIKAIEDAIKSGKRTIEIKGRYKPAFDY